MPEENKNTSYFILLGGAEHLDFFENNSAYLDSQWCWTVPKKAKVNDVCFIYLTKPVSRIVGKVRVIEQPFMHVDNTLFDSSHMRNKYCAEIQFEECFKVKRELTIKGLRELFGSDWGWLSMPRGKTEIPKNIIAPFLELFAQNQN